MRPSLDFAKGLFGDSQVEGVEVGVDIGENAADILSSWSNVVKLSLVDPADNIHDRFKAEGDRVKLFHKYSVDGAKEFEDNTLDFVYLDGDHSYNAVKDDLHSWYPKLKVGGVICGHDFSVEDVSERLCVAWAVTEFFNQIELDLHTASADFWGIKKC